MPPTTARTKSKAVKLKVFQAQFGFFDSVVAAPSQAAALRAWDTHQNLFADGQAALATDAAAVEAALAHPNVPLRRAVGSRDAFALNPTGLPAVPDLPKAARPKSKAGKPKARELPKPRRPDRSALLAAERAVAELEVARQAEQDVFRHRQAALDEDVSVARQRYEKRRAALTAAVASSRRAFREAGGDE